VMIFSLRPPQDSSRARSSNAASIRHDPGHGRDGGGKNSRLRFKGASP
jgi:hypothetical protein